ncbi:MULTISPECIES: DUF2269 family protein [Tabrizicola]|uniref:DUF2269 family protein n=1 Tax=Tabrizicola TaxID=1443919 RepID=UPI00108173BA|nr:MULTISPECIES: DUF2269 family protein [Paracoccaceae]
MDLVALLKFSHVIAAVLWVGGGFSMILATTLMARHAGAQAQMAVVRAAVLMAPRLFVPVSVFTLASGVALLFLAGWGWQPFTVLGLAGVLFTAGFGAIVLGPSCERALKLEETAGPDAALPLLRRIQRLAAIDYAIQFAIVFLMVVKPGWQDVGVLAGLAVVVALAALATLRPLPRTA